MAMHASSELAGPSGSLSREEGLALVLALLAHAGLIAALTLAPPGKTIMSPPERMTVTFADETADKSTSPDPDAEAAADMAPVLGQPAPVPEAAPPQPVQQVTPPQPQPKPAPLPQARPEPKPVPQPKPAPQPRVQPAPPVKPLAKPAPPKPAAAAPVDPRQRRRPDPRAGGSLIGPDFLPPGLGGTKPGATGNPASALSDQAKAAIKVSINRKVVPPWNGCPVNGLDIEKLRARVSFQLDRAGNVISIATPAISGQTPANAAQVSRFSECAVRAIKTAAPFSLPADSYDFWKSYTLNFSKKE